MLRGGSKAARRLAGSAREAPTAVQANPCSLSSGQPVLCTVQPRPWLCGQAHVLCPGLRPLCQVSDTHLS